VKSADDAGIARAGIAAILWDFLKVSGYPKGISRLDD
jgi:hypothetical protein